MAIHSSILVWRIPWTEEPGGRQSMSHKELDTTEQLTLSLWCHVQEVTKSNVIEEAFPLWFFPKRFCFFVFNKFKLFYLLNVGNIKITELRKINFVLCRL